MQNLFFISVYPFLFFLFGFPPALTCFPLLLLNMFSLYCIQRDVLPYWHRTFHLSFSKVCLISSGILHIFPISCFIHFPPVEAGSSVLFTGDLLLSLNHFWSFREYFFGFSNYKHPLQIANLSFFPSPFKAFISFIYR